jgi:hypothetical protein
MAPIPVPAEPSILAGHNRQAESECGARHRDQGNIRKRTGVLTVVSDYDDAAGEPRPANLILIEQSGAKREIPQPSPLDGMVEAEQAIHEHGNQLREVKVVSQHKAIARWKASELGWRRVA